MESKKNLRLNIPIDYELNKKLDDESATMGISKAGLVRVVLYDYFKQKEALKMVSEIDKLMEVLEQAKKLK